jgi:hypothetical protein
VLATIAVCALALGACGDADKPDSRPVAETSLDARCREMLRPEGLTLPQRRPSESDGDYAERAAPTMTRVRNAYYALFEDLRKRRQPGDRRMNAYLAALAQLADQYAFTANMIHNGQGDLLHAAQHFIDEAKGKLEKAASALDAPSCGPI